MSDPELPITTVYYQSKINGDIYRAQQDLQNADVWYLERFEGGEQAMRLPVSQDSLKGIFELLKVEKKTHSPNWYRNMEAKADVFYKMVLQGGDL